MTEVRISDRVITPPASDAAPGEVQVRKMRPDDLSGSLRILGLWNMAPLTPSAEVPEPERTSIDIENAFVADARGRIVGTCSYFMLGDGWAETASLAVDPDPRFAGVGVMLQQARLDEMRRRGVRHVRTETDRPATVRWYVRRFGYRIVGTAPKKHAFSLPDVDHWTVLNLDLDHAD
jgi:N-acetylglutamate synthase-like GNAT family acetyltransferase